MGSIRREIKGNVYGGRTALGEFYYKQMPSGKKLIMEKCRCECGTEKYVQRAHLLNGDSKNCGCERRKATAARTSVLNKIHGMEGTIPYKKFMAAKARCGNPNNPSYPSYGGRGIKLGRKDFASFWADMGDEYNEHVKIYGVKDTTLDRIDVNGNYCKDNCRWATWQEQYENRTDNVGVIYKGKKYPTISKLCRELGLKEELIRDRLRLGWKLEDAIDIPLLKPGEKHVKNRRPI